MRETQPLLSSVNSQGAVFAEVFLLAEISCSETLSASLHAREDIRTELFLHRHSYPSLTSCYTVHGLYAFKSPQSKVPCGYAVWSNLSACDAQTRFISLSNLTASFQNLITSRLWG